MRPIVALIATDALRNIDFTVATSTLARYVQPSFRTSSVLCFSALRVTLPSHPWPIKSNQQAAATGNRSQKTLETWDELSWEKSPHH